MTIRLRGPGIMPGPLIIRTLVVAVAVSAVLAASCGGKSRDPSDIAGVAAGGEQAESPSVTESSPSNTEPAVDLEALADLARNGDPGAASWAIRTMQRQYPDVMSLVDEEVLVDFERVCERMAAGIRVGKPSAETTKVIAELVEVNNEIEGLRQAALLGVATFLRFGGCGHHSYSASIEAHVREMAEEEDP